MEALKQIVRGGEVQGLRGFEGLRAPTPKAPKP